MKISIDDKELFTLNETQKKVIQHNVHSDVFYEDMKRRLKWVLFDEKYQNCFRNLKAEWEPKLIARGISSLPTNQDEFAKLVFSQPDYMDRAAKDIEQAKQDEIDRNSQKNSI